MEITRPRRDRVVVSPRTRKAIRTNAHTVARAVKGVRFASVSEGRELFDHQARKLLAVSGQEFLKHWDAGRYRDVADPETARRVHRLTMLMPFADRSGK